MPEKLIPMLIGMAEKRALEDMAPGTTPDDLAGGNIDDAFSSGESNGRILLARDVLDALGVPYKQPEPPA